VRRPRLAVRLSDATAILDGVLSAPIASVPNSTLSQCSVHRMSPASGAPYTETAIWLRDRD